MRRTLVAITTSAALLSTAPTAQAVCHYVKPQSAKSERIAEAINARRDFGFPHSRAGAPP